MSISGKTQSRLKPDNPRTLTPKAHEALRSDLEEYGDLSGIVYNLTTGFTIAGNQRTAVFDIANCKFEITHVNKKPDTQGTVKQGFVIWKGNRYAYREVKWSKKKEDAACIRANINAGEWDWEKLEKYDAEVLKVAGMDSDLLKVLERDENQLRAMLNLGKNESASNVPEFAEYDESIADGITVCECPTCGHKHAKKD